VKHRKKCRGYERFVKIAAYIAKQIPLCHAHFILVSTGKYDGPSLRKLLGYLPFNFK
jgi:hypothetical protein